MTGRGRIAATALLVVALFVLGSCGGSGSGVSSAAGAQLQWRVAAVREAAARGDRSTADDQLAHLRVDVVEFRAAHKVDDAAATRILRAAGAVETQLSLLASATTTTEATTTTTSTTTTTEAPPPEPTHKPKGHDKGNGGGGSD